MKLKTKAWQGGRDWPDEIVLDVGSHMPTDVFGCADTYAGVRYVRHDVVEKRLKAKEDKLTTRASMNSKDFCAGDTLDF